MSLKTKKILSWLIPSFLTCLVLILIIKTVHAQSALGGEWDQFLKAAGLKTFTGTGAEAGEETIIKVIGRGITIIKYFVGGVALIFGILYATNLVFARGNEETISKQKKNFLYTFMGFVVLMVAQSVADVFTPQKSTAKALIDFSAATDTVRNVATYLKWIFGSVIVFMMSLSGIRMIMASGNEEVITKQKRNIVWSGIGALVILLAGNIINAIYSVNKETGVATPGSPQTIAQQLAGVINLILIFLAPAAVLFTIYAGFQYLTALEDEEKTKKAKAMIIGGITGIVIIYGAYALVNTFLVEKTFVPIVTP